MSSIVEEDTLNCNVTGLTSSFRLHSNFLTLSLSLFEATESKVSRCFTTIPASTVPDAKYWFKKHSVQCTHTTTTTKNRQKYFFYIYCFLTKNLNFSSPSLLAMHPQSLMQSTVNDSSASIIKMFLVQVQQKQEEETRQIVKSVKADKYRHQKCLEIHMIMIESNKKRKLHLIMTHTICKTGHGWIISLEQKNVAWRHFMFDYDLLVLLWKLPKRA